MFSRCSVRVVPHIDVFLMYLSLRDMFKFSEALSQEGAVTAQGSTPQN